MLEEPESAASRLREVGTTAESVELLASIVRHGGARYAAELAEPLPLPEQTDVIRPWLAAASTDADEAVEAWLRSVAREI